MPPLTSEKTFIASESSSFTDLRESISEILGTPEFVDKVPMLSKRIDPRRNLSLYDVSAGLALVSTEYFPFEDTCSGGYNNQYTPKDIEGNRSIIRKEFIRFKDSAHSITAEDLKAIFLAYDKLWFGSRITNYFKENKYSLDFVTDSGNGFGITGLCAGTCAYTITIPARIFTNATPGTIVAGLKCTDSLDCLMRVIEHEMVHLIIFTYCSNSEFLSEQHSTLFTSTTKRLFGHTHYTHQIGATF